MFSNKKRRKDPFRQLQLEVTENNELTLTKYIKKKARENVHYKADPELFRHLPFGDLNEFEVVLALRPPFPILRLPEELVLQILEEAVRNGFQNTRGIPYRKTYRVPLLLCLVCTTFRRLVQPLIFSDLTLPLSGRDVLSDRCGDKLIRTLQTRKSMAQHCRRLEVDFSYGWPKDIDAATVMLSWFTSVDRLTVSGVFDNTIGNGEFSEDGLDLWRFIRLILQCTSRSKELCIHSRRGGFNPDLGLPLHPLCATISSMHTPHLKSLRIYGISKRIDGSSFVLPKNLEGTATISNLSIYACGESPSALTELMKWPIELESFSISDLFWYHYGGRLHDFETILHRHKGSLKSLSIDNVQAVGPLDLSDFIRLESFRLFSMTMSKKWKPEALCDKILAAPRLRSLAWDFAHFDEQCGSCTSYQDFGFAEAEWLREVARLANERRAALREIRIIFDPSDSHDEFETKVRSPWELMEDVRVELKTSNIELRINSGWR